jgi:hypothetical protein
MYIMEWHVINTAYIYIYYFWYAPCFEPFVNTLYRNDVAASKAVGDVWAGPVALCCWRWDLSIVVLSILS